MVIFRLNQVPELNYVKFLELLGIGLEPANPASVELTFTLVDPPPAPALVIPKGALVAAAPGSGPPVVFETDRALNALGPKLAAILAFDGFAFSDATPASASGQAFWPLGPIPRSGSALYLGFDFAAGFPDGVEVDLLALLAAGDSLSQGVTCNLGSGEAVPAAQITWEGWDGNSWVKLPLNRDDTRAFVRTGHVSLVVPSGLHLAKLQLAGGASAYYWVRGRAERASYDAAPQLTGLVTNSVPATAAQTVQDEILGGSDGSPSQQFSLFFSPVVAGTLVLEIDEGSGFRPWGEVEDFFPYGPDDTVFTLDRAQGVVTIGDGRNGRIPVANPANPGGGVVARLYQYGGGAAGNLPAGTINQVQSPLPGVVSVTNLRPSAGGSDTETVEEAKSRAAAQLKSRGRAVTPEDFSYLAMGTPGVRIRRAEVLPLAHPAFPGVPIPGVVTVVVVPDIKDAAPSPSEATLRAVCAQLDRYRLVTTEVHVAPPRYQLIRVQATVRVRASADLAVVRQAVDDALTRYFHPLFGGDDGVGWPLGGTIFYSLVVRTVMEANPGVARVDGVAIWLDGEESPLCSDVAVKAGALLYSMGHDISTLYVDPGDR
jgi:predicted phage baseplate assembly protein